MDTEFLRTLDRQILLGVFVAFVAASAGAAYYLSSSKKRRGCLDPENGRLSKWFHQKQHTNPNTMRNPKRKDKERVERARVHSAVSIAALAAGLASVTSSESCSKESGSMMTLALASATELLASHCIQMAEQAGADGN